MPDAGGWRSGCRHRHRAGHHHAGDPFRGGAIVRRPRRRLYLSSQCASAGFRNLQPVVREKTAGLWAGQAMIVWRHAFDPGADVAAIAADSGGLLRVTGRRESAARYKSLSFEFSAATAQGPTFAGQQARAAPYRAEFSLWRRRLRGGVLSFVEQVMPPARYTACVGKRSPLAVD